MTKDEVFEYVMNTPGNTNPAVLRDKLEKLAAGGGGGTKDGIPILLLEKASNGVYAVIDFNDNIGLLGAGRMFYAATGIYGIYVLLISGSNNGTGITSYFTALSQGHISNVTAKPVTPLSNVFTFVDEDDVPTFPGSQALQNKLLPNYSPLLEGWSLVINDLGDPSWGPPVGRKYNFPSEYSALFEQVITMLEGQAQQSASKSVTVFMPFDMENLIQDVYESNFPLFIIGDRKAVITNCTPDSFTFFADDVGLVSNNTFPYYHIAVTAVQMGFAIKVTYDEGTVLNLS